MKAIIRSRISQFITTSSPMDVRAFSTVVMVIISHSQCPCNDVYDPL